MTDTDSFMVSLHSHFFSFLISFDFTSKKSKRHIMTTNFFFFNFTTYASCGVSFSLSYFSSFCLGYIELVGLHVGKEGLHLFTNCMYEEGKERRKSWIAEEGDF